MDAKTSDCKPTANDGRENGRQPLEDEGKLERVLSFWGSYCYADVSSWTKDEIDEFSESLEEPPGSSRQKQEIPRVHRAIGGYSDDQG